MCSEYIGLCAPSFSTTLVHYIFRFDKSLRNLNIQGHTAVLLSKYSKYIIKYNKILLTLEIL
jgi:hypothetical protein